MTRDELIGMLREQTPACGAARAALIAGAGFGVHDGTVPANRHAGVFRRRMHHSVKRGRTVDGLAESVEILRRAGEQPLRSGFVEAVDRSSWFTLFLDPAATEVVACFGGRRHITAEPAGSPEADAPESDAPQSDSSESDAPGPGASEVDRPEADAPPGK